MELLKAFKWSTRETPTIPHQTKRGLTRARQTCQDDFLSTGNHRCIPELTVNVSQTWNWWSLLGGYGFLRYVYITQIIRSSVLVNGVKSEPNKHQEALLYNCQSNASNSGVWTSIIHLYYYNNENTLTRTNNPELTNLQTESLASFLIKIQRQSLFRADAETSKQGWKMSVFDFGACFLVHE